MTDYIQVMTTVENKSDAEKIAKYLVEERIAACVQILGPLQSFFYWQGKLDRADEYLCLIKSRDDSDSVNLPSRRSSAIEAQVVPGTFGISMVPSTKSSMADCL